MFTVYNKGSVTFQSTSGNLYNLKNVDEAAESRLKPDDDRIDSFDNKMEQKKGSKYSATALGAYKKMADFHESDEVFFIKDIMIKEFISINEQATIEETYALLKENGISQVPIINDEGAIISMINKKFILNLLMDDLDYVRNNLKKTLNSIFLPEVVTTAPNTDIRAVAKVLSEYHLDAIPIVDNNHLLVGIVTKTNIIKAIADIPHIQFFA